MQKVLEILKRKWIWLVVAVGVLVLIIVFISGSKANVPEKTAIAFDDSNKDCGIPCGWDPTPCAVALKNAQKGWGTDEGMIKGILMSLTKEQVAAVYNKYQQLYHSGDSGDLISDLEDELSGDDLSTALSYSRDIQFKSK